VVLALEPGLEGSEAPGQVPATLGFTALGESLEEGPETLSLIEFLLGPLGLFQHLRYTTQRERERNTK
jgi:hypothetical protein